MSLSRSSNPSAASSRTANAQGPATPDAPPQTATNKCVPIKFLPGESPEAYIQLHHSLRAEWRPDGFCEDELVAELAGLLWQTRRVKTAQDQLHINCASRLAALDRQCQRITGLLVRHQKRVGPRELPADAIPSPTASSRLPFIRRKG